MAGNIERTQLDSGHETGMGKLTYDYSYEFPYYQGKIQKIQPTSECRMEKTPKLPLPIDSYIPDIVKAVQDYPTVLVKASPGSGKTTRLPWAISQGLKKRVVVLEPRRLAAKLAAQRIADEEGLIPGQEVGYHFRFEKNVSEKTLLTFYTEGTFLKRFQNDQLLSNVDVVILDEFHERHLETDLALAFLRDVQKKRPLKIILMSATLDSKLSGVFPEAKYFEIEAPMFPVEVTYLANQPSILNQTLEAKVRKAVEQSPEGDVLVFLPGMREMLKVKESLPQNEKVFLLHADLSKEEQKEAISPSKTRKIILATNIAESSVTIPGVKVVIDAGIQREAHYSAWNGLKLLQDRPITKSSAIQRAGRAGRTGPGVCHRLYSQQDFNERPDHTIAEIQKADLTDTYLLVTASGMSPDWFEAPPQDKWKKAEELLEKLGAIADGKITPIGKQIQRYPLDTRLSRILVAGEKLTLNEKKKLLRYICEEIEGDRSLERKLHFFLTDEGTETSFEKCILTGFIDQVAKYRSKQRDFIHYSGKIIKSHPSLDLQDGFTIILDITQRQEAIKVLEIEESWIWDIEPFPVSEEELLEVGEKFSLKRLTKIGSIVLEESSTPPVWSELQAASQRKLFELTKTPFQNKLKQLLETETFERILFYLREMKVDTSEFFSALSMEKFLKDQTSLSWEYFEDFVRGEIESVVSLSDIDRKLPVKISLGGRRDLMIHYPAGQEPFIEAPIQDFYGHSETPSVMEGKIPVLLKLLGPHKRPIQVTKDLKGFWHKTYQEMKKEYQREYPKHYWPDKPWEAKPFLLKSHLPKV